MECRRVPVGVESQQRDLLRASPGSCPARGRGGSGRGRSDSRSPPSRRTRRRGRRSPRCSPCAPGLRAAHSPARPDAPVLRGRRRSPRRCRTRAVVEVQLDAALDDDGRGRADPPRTASRRRARDPGVSRSSSGPSRRASWPAPRCRGTSGCGRRAASASGAGLRLRHTSGSVSSRIPTRGAATPPISAQAIAGASGSRASAASMSASENSGSSSVPGEVRVVGGEVEVAVAAEAEQDHALLAGLLAASASSITARIACAGSGAGMIPSVRANCTAAVERLVLLVGARLDRARLHEPAQHRRVAVVAQPAGVHGRRDEVVPERVHRHQRRQPGGVAEVVAVDAAGQRRARRGLGGDEPRARARRAGTGTPARRSSSRRRRSRRSRPAPRPPAPSAAIASCPITVWCSSTWLSTEPSE